MAHHDPHDPSHTRAQAGRLEDLGVNADHPEPGGAMPDNPPSGRLFALIAGLLVIVAVTAIIIWQLFLVSARELATSMGNSADARLIQLHNANRDLLHNAGPAPCTLNPRRQEVCRRRVPIDAMLDHMADAWATSGGATPSVFQRWPHNPRGSHDQGAPAPPERARADAAPRRDPSMSSPALPDPAHP